MVGLWSRCLVLGWDSVSNAGKPSRNVPQQSCPPPCGPKRQIDRDVAMLPENCQSEIGESATVGCNRNASPSPPLRGETGGRRGAVQGSRDTGGQARQRAPLSPRTGRDSRPRSSRSGSTHAPAGIALPVPLTFAAAEPHPLISTAAAQPPPLMNAACAQRSGDPSAAALPMLCIASPAASPPRRTCGRSAAPGPPLARVCRRPHRGCPCRVPVRCDAHGFGAAAAADVRFVPAPAQPQRAVTPQPRSWPIVSALVPLPA